MNELFNSDLLAYNVKGTKEYLGYRNKIENDSSKKIFQIMYKICYQNNTAKAQIFKGIGHYHFKVLLKSHNLNCAIF